MSGVMDEILIPIVPIVVGTAVVAVGTAALAVAGIGALTVGLTAEAISGTLNGISSIKDSINSLKNIAIEEKTIYNKAFEKYKNQILENQQKKTEFFEKISANINWKTINCDDSIMKIVDNYPISDKLNIINSISQVIYYIENLNNLFFTLSEENIELDDIENSIYAIKNEISKNIKNGKFKQLDLLVPEIQKSIKELKDIIVKRNNENKIIHYEKIDSQLFIIENQIGLPYVYIFRNELSNLLNSLSETDMELTKNQKLLEIKKEVINISQEISNLDYITNFDECNNLLNSVNDILMKADLSVDTKLNMVDIRRKLLRDTYIEFKNENSELLIKKNEYDKNFNLLTIYCNYLKLIIPKYEFKYDDAEMQIKKLKNKLEELKPIVEDQQRSEFIRKSIREVMKEMEFDFIDSQQSIVNGKEIKKDIFHIENGNVVSVTTANNGYVSYKVSGVKLPGISDNKASVVNTMQKFCDKTKLINQKLFEKGLSVEVTELLAPDVKWASEIDLSRDIDFKKYEYIRKAKLGKKSNETIKQKVIE